MKHTSLLIMAGLHFIIMYIVMYAMVNTLSNIYPNLNNGYMAAMMTAPMLLIEIALMGSMYKNKKALSAIFIGSVIVFIASFFFIRSQTLIGDKEFIRSMIPHHSGAILMCREADIEDQELRTLCDEIIQAQQEEIDQMEQILNRL